jgi:hypothetical protein
VILFLILFLKRKKTTSYGFNEQSASESRNQIPQTQLERKESIAPKPHTERDYVEWDAKEDENQRQIYKN